MRIESNTNLTQLIQSLETGSLTDQVAAIAAHQTEDSSTMRRAGQATREVEAKNTEAARQEMHAAIDQQRVAGMFSAGASLAGAVAGGISDGGWKAVAGSLGAAGNGVATWIGGEAGHKKVAAEAQLERAQRGTAEGNETLSDAQSIDRVANSSRDAMRQVAQLQHQAEMAALRA